MPKRTKDFPDRLEFVVPHNMLVGLIALSYLTQRGGSYAGTARNLLDQAITTAVAALSPERRKAYNEILGNVVIAHPEGSSKKGSNKE